MRSTTSGSKEVERIRGEMDTDYRQGSASRARFQEFLTFLRTDPQFYYKTPDELFDALRGAREAHRSAAGEALRQAAAHALRRAPDSR